MPGRRLTCGGKHRLRRFLGGPDAGVRRQAPVRRCRPSSPWHPAACPELAGEPDARLSAIIDFFLQPRPSRKTSAAQPFFERGSMPGLGPAAQEPQAGAGRGRCCRSCCLAAAEAVLLTRSDPTQSRTTRTDFQTGRGCAPVSLANWPGSGGDFRALMGTQST